jgi:hypothetical protein
MPQFRALILVTLSATVAPARACRMGQKINTWIRLWVSYCCPTTAKSLITLPKAVLFSQDVQVKKRADERTLKNRLPLLQLRGCLRTYQPVLVRPGIALI